MYISFDEEFYVLQDKRNRLTKKNIRTWVMVKKLSSTLKRNLTQSTETWCSLFCDTTAYPRKLSRQYTFFYDKSTSRVYVDGHLSEPFDITTGVLQGDVLVQFLFIIVIDYVTKLSEGEFGYLTHKDDSISSSRQSVRSTTRQIDHRIGNLAFADETSSSSSSSAGPRRRDKRLQMKQPSSKTTQTILKNN